MQVRNYGRLAGMRVCLCSAAIAVLVCASEYFLSPTISSTYTLTPPQTTHTHHHPTIKKQINVANVDANGVYTQGDFKTVALAGYIRGKGGADAALVEVVKAADLEG